MKWTDYLSWDELKSFLDMFGSPEKLLAELIEMREIDPNIRAQMTMYDKSNLRVSFELKQNDFSMPVWMCLVWDGAIYGLLPIVILDLPEIDIEKGLFPYRFITKKSYEGEK